MTGWCLTTSCGWCTAARAWCTSASRCVQQGISGARAAAGAAHAVDPPAAAAAAVASHPHHPLTLGSLPSAAFPLQAGFHTRSQEEIHELLLQFAEAGATVVRLKGGDPYVFGRCAAESTPFKSGADSSGPCSLQIPLLLAGQWHS